MKRVLWAAFLGSTVGISACSILAPTDDDLLGGSTAGDASLGGASGSAGAAGGSGAGTGGTSATGGASGSSGASGSAGSGGAGTGATGGAGGSAGSGGGANCRPKPTGGTACGSPSCSCGAVDCKSYNLGGVFNVAPCCGGASKTLCGIQIDGAVAAAAGLAPGCYAEQPLGNLDSSCPWFAIPNPTVPGSNIEFPGCCTPAGSCGLSMDLNGLGGPTLGCLETSCGGGAPPQSCTPN